MKVTELNREQLTALKQDYLMQRQDEQGETPSMEELTNVDATITDEEVFAAYKDTDFTPEDFAS